MQTITTHRRMLAGILLLLLAVRAGAFDQKDYKAYAETVRQEVWGMDLPEFRHPKPTDRFADQSAVILAAYDEYDVTKRDKFNFFSATGTVAEVKCYTITRQQVQINDEAALKLYSEFDFMSYARRRSLYYGKMEMRRVLGVRIIKPDGTVNEVPTDDYVVTTEGTKGRDERQKLAVPGLQVGDIIDVFTYVYSKTNGLNPAPMTFFYVSDSPMLSYRVHCEIDGSLATQYTTLNGAPDFEVTTTADGDYVLDAAVSNVAQTEPRWWYLTSQQTPLAMLYVNIFASPKSKMNSQRRGLQRNPDAALIQADDWRAWNWPFALTKRDKTVVKEAVARYADDEQRADYIYEYCVAYALSGSADISSARFVSWLRQMFKKAGITYQCGMTTSEGREPIDRLANVDNTTWFLRLPAGKCYFAPAFAGVPGELAYQYQGRKAVVCPNMKKPAQGPYEHIVLPQTSAADNVVAMALTADIDGTQMNIGHQYTVKGNARSNISLYVPTREQTVGAMLSDHASMQTLASLYDAKWADALAERAAEENRRQEENVKSLVASYYESEPAAMGPWSITSMGVKPAAPDFSFEVSYTMDGLVKRAGQNLIVAVGKLIGSQLKLEGRDRQRTADIIREMPTTYEWDITLRLPDGYTLPADALSQLRADLSNEVGAFRAEPSLEAGALRLKISKTLLHKREPADRWPQVLALYDAVSDYTARQAILVR